MSSILGWFTHQVSKDFAFNLEAIKQAFIYPQGVRPVLELGQNIAFVLNVSRIACQPRDELALAPGHSLRRANEQEVLAIKDVCKDYGIKGWAPWECTESIKGKFKRLPEERWRYFVIAFTGSNSTTVEIEQALSIALCDIKIAFTLMKGPLRDTSHPTLLFDPGRLFHLLQGIGKHVPFIVVTASHAKNIRSLHNRLRLYDNNMVNVKGIIQQLMDLEALSQQSPLLFLGYFAILESLLTHPPKKTDTIDSITRQIIKKVTLLDNRWHPRIDYGRFEDAKPDTIWSTMYSYRSALAHGGAPDFKRNLRLLGEPTSALALLKHTVKGVLRQALIEPQLLIDLRNC